MFKFALPALFILLSPLSAASQDAAPEPATETPKPPAPGQKIEGPAPAPADFVTQASASNAFEMQSAELAQKRSRQTFVRDFAALLLSDHTKAQAELEAAAKEQNVAFEPALSDKQKEKLDALQKATDADFDAAFLSTQMSAHQAAMELFARYAERGEKGPLKAHAEAQYPALHMHFIRAHNGSTQ